MRESLCEEMDVVLHGGIGQSERCVEHRERQRDERRGREGEREVRGELWSKAFSAEVKAL